MSIEENIQKGRETYVEYARLSKNQKNEFLRLQFKDLTPKDVEDAKKYTIEYDKREAEETKIRLERETERLRIQNLPSTKAPRLYRNKSRDPEGWETWLKTETTANHQQLVEEIKKNPHAFRSTYNYDVSGFVEAVEIELIKRQQAEQPSKSLVSKIKNKVESYAT